MPYPRQLNLGTETEEKLAAWLETELTNHLAERGKWVQSLVDLQFDYLAAPAEKAATYPFAGASTIIVPLQAITVEATYARTKQTLFALDKKISAQVFTDQKDKVERPLEDYLQQELFLDIKFPEKVESALLELHKLGTGIATAEYEHVVRKGIRVVDGEEQEFDVVVRQGACVKSVPLSNFLQPFESEDPQTARWCGEVFWMTPNEIYAAEREGRFQKGTYEKLSRHFMESPHTTDTTKYRTSQEKYEQRTPIWPQRVELFNIYTAFDVDEETWDQEIVLTYHRDSRSFVSVTYNPYWDYRRPYRRGVYFPVEHRWPGIGVGHQMKMFQEEMTAIHRQRLDNGAIANLRMFKVSRNSGIKEGEPLFPGKLWFLDDMDDVQPLEMGDVKASAYNNENQILLLGNMRSGINELTLGMPQMGTPGTATDSAARIQESARKFDLTYANTRDFLDQLVEDTLCNIVQWGPSLKRLEVLEGGREVEMFLRNNYDDIRNRIICKVGLASQNQNNLLDRQNMTQISGVLTQYYTQILGLAQQKQDPTLVAAITDQALTAATEAMRQFLETFQMRNPEKLLFTPPNANTSISQPAGLIGPGSGGSQGAPPDLSVSSTNIVAPNLTSVLPTGATGLPY